MSNKKNKRIEVPIIARVEGEGALDIDIEHQRIASLKLRIYEPPRLFEKFLEGRAPQEVIDMVARICGICPVAYQTSAAQALEQCFGIAITPFIRQMRRLFYCGEWLESHSLHVHFLAAPDFLGFHSAPEMAKIYPEEVKRGLRLQGFGNRLIALFGGRSVHPVGARPGGFFKAPSTKAVSELLAEAEQRLVDAEALIRWLAKLELPDNSHDFTSVALSHPDEYAICEGRLTSTDGLDIHIDAFDDYFKESQVPYSTALHCLLQGKDYLVGPLARLNINHEQLPAALKTILKSENIQFPSQNMCLSIVARAVEIYYAVHEARRLMEHYRPDTESYIEYSPQSGIGIGCTEAPRGFLWHRYEFDEQGLVNNARIVPPTSQNQARIEADLKHSLIKFGLNQSDEALRHYSEMLIRNYDPCISCSTHFLTLKVRR